MHSVRGPTFIALLFAVVALATSTSTHAQATTVTVTPGDRSITVEWTAVAGAAIYYVQWRKAPSGTLRQAFRGSSQTRRYVITGDGGTVQDPTLLTNGDSYLVSVRSVGTGGDHTSAEQTVTVGVAPPPDPPTFTATSTAYFQASVAWTAVADATNYGVRWRVGTSDWTSQLTGNVAAYTITGLAGGTYEVQMRVLVSGRYSEWSASQTATVAAAPAPTFTLDASEYFEIAVAWTAVTGGTNYALRWRVTGTGNWTERLRGNVDAHTITGLAAGTYEVQMRVLVVATYSAWSASQTATVEAAPPPTYTLDASEYNEIAVSWTAVAGGTNYALRWRVTGTSDWTERVRGTQSAYTITGLDAGTYEVQMRVLIVATYSEWSGSQTATVADPPPPPITSSSLPALLLLRNPVDLDLAYSAVVAATSTLLVTADAVLSLSPACDVSSASYENLPTSVRVYPCAAGSGSVTVRVDGLPESLVATGQVVTPRFSYDVAVTSQATTAQPQVLWRSPSWPLYRDGLVTATNVVVTQDGTPLAYAEQGDRFDAVTVCAIDCSATTLWSDPPAVGDEVYFLSDAPIALLRVTLTANGRRDIPWAVDWEYGTATGWEPLPRPDDGTDGLRKTGTVLWDQIDTERPMAVRTLYTRTAYAVRATLSSAGSGDYTRPVVTSVGAQSGLWGATLTSPLSPGAAAALTVYILASDAAAPSDYRTEGPSVAQRESPPADLVAQVGAWRPWSAPAAAIPVATPMGVTAPSIPPDLTQPINEEGGLPLIGFAVERASISAGVPTLLLWTMIMIAIAFAVLVAVQRAASNILISVIAGGMVLGLLSTPTIGLSSVWVIMVYGLIGGAVVVIGRRISL